MPEPQARHILTPTEWAYGVFLTLQRDNASLDRAGLPDTEQILVTLKLGKQFNGNMEIIATVRKGCCRQKQTTNTERQK
jgi:hypothetical protein